MDESQESLSPPAEKKLKLDDSMVDKLTDGLDPSRNKNDENKTAEIEDENNQVVQKVCEVRAEELTSKTIEQKSADTAIKLSDEPESAEKLSDHSTLNDVSENLKSEKKPDLQTRILETDVGILEYISECAGFQAVIKQRYSDFLVNEINMDGKVVELTNLDLPSAVPEQVSNTSDYSAVSGLMSEEDIEQLKELQTSGDQKRSVLIKTSDEKAVRGLLHNAIEKGFPGLNTSTVTKDDQKYIEARITNNRGSGYRQWPKGRGEYCRFVLYKEAKDTMDAIGLISSKLRLKTSLFQYAGTKDKRSKSSQEVTVYRVAAEKLNDVNKQLRNIVTGNYRYTSSKLQLGQLQGNKFTIVLRSVKGTEEEIESGMISLRDCGFINYYGMQRFGVFTVPTHHIGRALLSSNWKEAIELILKPREGEDKMMTEARELWWKMRDSKEALAKFPKYAYIERNILQGLVDRGSNDYMGALNKVARNTRLMYVHAYQSYIWNTAVSHRVKKHGLQVVCGDLVIPHKSFILTEVKPVISSQAMEAQILAAYKRWLLYTDIEGIPGETVRTKVTPTIVDESNIGDYTVYDVVLPKPGYDVRYPTNDIEVLYKDLMEKDGLDYKNMRSKHKDFSLSGDYRHIVVKPANVTWKLFRYNDFTIPLALSDWDKMNNLPEPESVKGGSHLALRLELTLPTSCYATMALRELLKTDTSSSYQATLNT